MILSTYNARQTGVASPTTAEMLSPQNREAGAPTFASPFPLGTPVTTRESSQPTDVYQNPQLAAMAPDPTPAGSDAGLSRNRNLEVEVDAADECPGFGDTASRQKSNRR